MTTEHAVRFFDRTTPPHVMTLVLLSGLAAMNMSVFLPSLPSMTVAFDTRYEVMQLAVSLYLAITAVNQLVVGPIADKIGRRPVILGSLGIFIAATVGCLFAPNIETFLVFRMLQAAVATTLVLSRAVVRDLYPPDESAAMIGYVTMGMALVPMIAPMIGGALEQAFGWESTFVFLIIAGMVMLVMAWSDLGETNRASGRSFREQLAETPELFRSRRFWGYVAAAAFASGSFFAFLGGAPYVASEVYGLSSFWSGVAFGAPAVGYAIGNFASARLSVRLGINRMVLSGTVITTAGLLVAVLLGVLGVGNAFVFFGFCTFIGLGNGLVVPNSSAGMLSVRPHLAGTASGFGGAAMIGGGAVLSVFAGIVLRLGETSLPLLTLMLVSSSLAVASILYVIRREAEVGA